MKFLLYSIATLLTFISLQGQPIDETMLEQIVNNRSEKNSPANEAWLTNTFIKADSATRVALLNFFDARCNSNSPYTAARSLLWKAIIIYRPPFNKNDPYLIMEQAIGRAVESGDDFLMLECITIYADHCRATGKTETALFYYLKAAELMEKTGVGNFNNKKNAVLAGIGILYFNMQEYALAITYIKLGIDASRNAGNTSNLNTIGLCYQRMARYDSSIYWYSKANLAAIKQANSLWQGIISGNIGAIYFEQHKDEQALPLLWKDYNTTLKYEPNNAGNTLHRIALIYLRKSNMDSALLLARRSLQIVSAGKPLNPLFIMNAHKAMSEIFKKNNLTDSAFYYGDIYHHINDSINQAIARNRLDVVQIKLDFEKTANRINTLLTEKKTEKVRRNLLLAGFVLLLATTWLLFRWQQQKNLAMQQSLLYKKQMADAAVHNAKKQLEEFTQNILSKNELIEKLQLQLLQQNAQVNEELLNQSILTETDWLQFKDMFDKANPGFIQQLQKTAPGITNAELRFATLVKLNMGNKHIATMLGIGTDAVRKTKSRLRQRLQINAEQELEDFIKNV